MNPTRTQIGVFVAALVGVVALVLSGLAYSNTNSWAARINGVEISERQFLDELAVAVAHPGQSGVATETSGAVPLEASVNQLVQRVLGELVIQLVDERKLEITDAHRREAEQNLIVFYGGEEEFKKIPQWYRERVVRRDAAAAAFVADVGGAPTEAELRELYDQFAPDLIESCVSIITTATAESAEAVKVQLEAGADFAQLATENSIDPLAAQGGDAGCVSRGTLGVEPLESEVLKAPVDTVSGPIETQIGFHVFRVAKRDVVPFEDVRPQLEQQAQSAVRDRVFEFLVEATSTSSIEINPKYCTSFSFTLNGPECVPPVAPSPPDELPVGGVAPGEELLPPGLLPTGP